VKKRGSGSPEIVLLSFCKVFKRKKTYIAPFHKKLNYGDIEDIKKLSGGSVDFVLYSNNGVMMMMMRWCS